MAGAAGIVDPCWACGKNPEVLAAVLAGFTDTVGVGLNSSASGSVLADSTNWVVTRLPSALDASRSNQRTRPWLNRSEQEARDQERIMRVRRENGIPSPEEWMW